MKIRKKLQTAVFFHTKSIFFMIFMVFWGPENPEIRKKKTPECYVFQYKINIFPNFHGFHCFRGALQDWLQPPPDFPDS